MCACAYLCCPHCAAGELPSNAACTAVVVQETFLGFSPSTQQSNETLPFCTPCVCCTPVPALVYPRAQDFTIRLRAGGRTAPLRTMRELSRCLCTPAIFYVMPSLSLLAAAAMLGAAAALPELDLSAPAMKQVSRSQ
ncbi:hypothetical protein EON66_07945 [archaeon]|nr:MAG: hypothetical protein EON66_07945 [archaeon]